MTRRVRVLAWVALMLAWISGPARADQLEVAIVPASGLPSGPITVHGYMSNNDPQIGDAVAPTFREYIMRVVLGEMGTFPQFLAKAEVLKAQAVAATSIYFHKKGSDGSIVGTKAVQAYEATIPIPSEVSTAVNEVFGQIVTYNGTNIDAEFFSSCQSTPYRTRNAEQGGNYQGNSYLRSVVSPELPSAGSGGPRLGMSQYGALILAQSGWLYQDILKHYYGPVPPYLEAVRVLQSGATKYERRWVDNNDFYTILDPRPTRTLRNEQGAAVSPSSIIGPVRGPFQLQLDFREVVKASARNFTFQIGSHSMAGFDVKDAYGAGGGIQNPPERWTVTFADEDLQTMDGNHQITVSSEHELIPGWRLDRNPATMYYQLRGQQEERNYEPGEDVNHSIEIDNFRPFIRDVIILQGTPRYHGTWQYVNSTTRRLEKSANVSIDTGRDLSLVLKFSEPMNVSTPPSLRIERKSNGENFSFNIQNGTWSNDRTSYALTTYSWPNQSPFLGTPPSDYYYLNISGALTAVQNNDLLDAKPASINRKDASGNYPGVTGTNDQSPDREHIIKIGNVSSIIPIRQRSPRPSERKASGRALSISPEIAQPGLRIVADVTSVSSYPIRDVRLYYRPQNSTDKQYWNYGDYANIPMTAASDGKYVAVIPPRYIPGLTTTLNKDILDAGVEWMIVATTGSQNDPEIVTYPPDEPTVLDWWPVYKPQPSAIGEQPLLARVIAGDQNSPYGVVNRGDTDPANDFWRLEFYVPEGSLTSSADIDIALANVDNAFVNETSATFLLQNRITVFPNDWQLGRKWAILNAPAEGNWSVRLSEASNPQIFTDGDYLLVHAAAIDPVSNAIIASRTGTNVSGGGAATITAATAFIGGDLERPVALANVDNSFGQQRYIIERMVGIYA